MRLNAFTISERMHATMSHVDDAVAETRSHSGSNVTSNHLTPGVTPGIPNVLEFVNEGSLLWFSRVSSFRCHFFDEDAYEWRTASYFRNSSEPGIRFDQSLNLSVDDHAMLVTANSTLVELHHESDRALSEDTLLNPSEEMAVQIGLLGNELSHTEFGIRRGILSVNKLPLPDEFTPREQEEFHPHWKKFFSFRECRKQWDYIKSLKAGTWTGWSDSDSDSLPPLDEKNLDASINVKLSLPPSDEKNLDVSINVELSAPPLEHDIETGFKASSFYEDLKTDDSFFKSMWDDLGDDHFIAFVHIFRQNLKTLTRGHRLFHYGVVILNHIYMYFLKDNFFHRVLVVYDLIVALGLAVDKEFFIGLVQRLTREINANHGWEPSSFVEYARTASKALDKGATAIRDVQTTSAWISINKIFAAVIGHGMCGDVLPAKLIYTGLVKVGDIHEWRNRTDVPSMASELMAALSTVITWCINDQDFNEFQINDAYSWIECVRWLQRYEHTRSPTIDNIPEGYVSNTVWLKNLNHCDDKFLKVLSRDPTVRALQNSLQRSVTEMVAKARCAEYGKRPLPFNLALHSAPGTGKSTWVAHSVIQTVLSGLGVQESSTSLETIETQTCTVNQSDKFMSTYHPNKHLAVILDEMGSANPKYSMSNEIMSNITSLLGEGEFFLNSAALADKGKTMFRPHVNVCISNERDFGVSDYVRNDNAFYRRLNVIATIRIKPDYRLRSSNGDVVDGVDSTKIKTDRTEAIEFKLLEPTPNGFRERDRAEDVGWLSYRDFADIVMMKAREHRVAVSALEKTRDYLDSIHEQRCEHGLYTCSICKTGSSDYVRSFAEKERMTQSLPVSTLIPMEASSATIRLGEEYSTGWMIFLYLFQLFTICGWGVFLVVIGLIAWFWPSLNRRCDMARAQLDILRHDVRVFKDTLEHADALIARVKLAQKASLQKACAAALGLCGACALGTIVYKAMNKEKAAELARARAEAVEEYKASSTSANPFVPEDSPAYPKELEGSAPVVSAQGNPYDANDGFLAGGAASSSPECSVMKRVTRNLIKVCITTGNNDSYTTHLLGICDQYAIGVYHTLRHFSDKHTVLSVLTATDINKVCRNTHRMMGTPEHFCKIGEDLAMVKLTDVSAFRDIRNIICRGAQYAGSVATLRGQTTYFRSRNSFEPFTTDVSVSKSKVCYKDIVDPTRNYSPSTLTGRLPFTYPGMCGSPLISQIGSQRVLNGIVSSSNGDLNIGGFHTFTISEIEKGVNYLSRGLVMTPASSCGFEDHPDGLFPATAVTAPTRHNHAWWLSKDERGSMKLVGNFAHVNTRKPRSSVVDFPHAKMLSELFPPEYAHSLVRPVFSPYKDEAGYHSIERNTLMELANQVTGLNPTHLQWAIDDLVAKFITVEDFVLDMVLDEYTCINGTCHSSLVSSMPKSTSAGWPDGGKKYEHLVPDPREQAPDGFSLTPEARKRLNEMTARAAAGERNGVVYRTCVKDEPRDAQKVKERKIRIFTLGPMCFFLLCKKFYGMWSSIFTKNFLETETVGGVNPFSPDWGRVYKRLRKFDRVINGDFSKFDKKSSVYILMAAFTVIVRVKEHFLRKKGEDLSSSHYNALRSIASDISNPLLLMGRDMLEIPGSLSSGVLLTFLINNIVNSLYIRLAYYHCMSKQQPDVTGQVAKLSFRNNVVFYALGDDNTYSVSDESLKFFNFKTVQEYFKSIGLKYTNAAKTDDVYGSLPITEATIGKRRWVYDDESKLWKCPIEKPSILKGVTIGIASKSIPLEEQEDQAVDSAVIELSQYSRKEFEARVSDLRMVYPKKKFTSYDELIAKQVDGGVTPWIPEESSSELQEFTVPPS